MLVDLSNPAVVAHVCEWLASHRARLLACLPLLEPAQRLECSVKTHPGEVDVGAVKSRHLNRAAVFDIDEVLLCNIRASAGGAVERRFPAVPPAPPSRGAEGLGARVALFRAAMRAHERGGAETWPPDRAWRHLTADRTGLNPPMPGARELLGACRERGVRVYLVTGRREHLRADTVANLEIAGLLGEHTGLHAADLAAGRGRLVMWAGDCPVQAFKERARERIAKNSRIVLNVGDQLSDLGRHGEAQVLIPHSFYCTR